MPHANYAGAYRETIKAGRPETGEPVKEKSVLGCPICGSKNSVRILTFAKVRRYMCTRCDVEYNESGVISLDKQKPAAKPKYEQTYTAAKRLNKKWNVSEAERVVKRFRELVDREVNPLEAIRQIGREIGRDHDEVLILIVDLAGTDWMIVPDKKPESEKKKFPSAVREMLGVGFA